MAAETSQIDMPAAPAPAAPPASSPSRPSTLRRFFETAILFVTVIIVVRAVALEPFGVPTGSMANTLFGNHKSCSCPRCGYPIAVGGSGVGRPPRDPYRHAYCPNCGEGDLPLESLRESAGDRLLVDKNVFELRKPRRWEVAVFRCPFDANKPYVKRIVGLPGERVLLKDGDVQINGVLTRKSLDECRVVRVPVFDNNFQPPGKGWKVRWQHGPPDLARPDPSRNSLMRDADAFLDGASLHWRASEQREHVIYRNWLLNENTEAVLQDDFGYNGGNLPHRLNPVHDFFVEFDLEVGPGAGLFVVGLRDGHEELTVTLPIAGAAKGCHLKKQDGQIVAESSYFLQPGKTHRVEFAFFDRRAMLAIDGQEPFTAFDFEPRSDRQPVSRPCWLGASGTSFTVRNFRLFRDVHYAASGGECRNGVYEPWPLGPDEYFLLGDNSANSQDSRFWTSAGIPESCFMGKPLLLHQPSRWTRLGAWDIECIDWRRVRWIR